MTGKRTDHGELWLLTIHRVGNVLLFVIVLTFFDLLHGLSLSFSWEGNMIMKDRPVASEAKPDHSKHAPFEDLYIGRPRHRTFPEYIIQAQDIGIAPEEISEFLDAAREKHEEILLQRFYVRLFIGRDVPMELVGTVQLELRRAGVSKVMYMAWSAIPE